MNINNDINQQILVLLEDLAALGNISDPRGLSTVEANLVTLTLDPKRVLLNFKSRPFNYKYLAGELGWYIDKDTSVENIGRFSSFWKTIAVDGKANSNYGNLVLKDYPTDAEKEGEKIHVNQLEWVYKKLTEDKNTRQAVAFFNSPYFQYDGNKDFVCTMYVNFWIRHDCLHMKVQMRSNDVFFGLTFDAPWFSTIMQSMYLNLKKVYPALRLGYYYHCADNMHYYARHYDLVEKILSEEKELISPEFEVIKPIFEFDENKKLVITNEAETLASDIRDYLSGNVNTPEESGIWKTLLKNIYKLS
jgi:thymidylate synthase